MKTDITELLNGKKSTLPLDFEIIVDPEDENAPLPPEFMQITAPVSVSGEIADRGGYLELNARVRAPYSTECYRCLERIEGVFETDFSRYITADASDTDADSEDYIIAVDGMIDFSEVLMEELMLSFPDGMLCREDCPGLCPVCGKRLADGDCGCSAKKEPDPRFDVLRDMLKRMKEAEASDKAETEPETSDENSEK